VTMNGWNGIETAPTDGTRVRVAHVADAFKSQGVTGSFVNGRWECSEGFIAPDMRFFTQPTHWLPIEEAAPDRLFDGGGG
jgi:hypothetical protein